MKRNKDSLDGKKSIRGSEIPFATAELLDAIPFDIFNYAEKNDAFKQLVS
ncbi:MAG: hypothetical protein PHP53_24390 [Prolixibacteraceae bacterium]|nr:hypothetical protein [Prolixibacteraceae bacterium]